MRSIGLCSNLKLKLCEVFNESLTLEERLKKGHELCDGLENAGADKDIQDLTMSIYEKVQKCLTSTEPQNLQESATQKLRKLCLEILQKLPNGDHLRPYARPILSMLFKLVEVENEDNVLLCVKLIIDLHKYYRPSFSSDVTCFLSFVRRVYRGLHNETVNIFEPQPKIEIQSVSELKVAAVVEKAFTVTTVYTQETEIDGSLKTYHILPKSCFSLKVMQEIPILVVLMYQLFKQHIHQDVSEFIPLIMDFINLHPTEKQKSNALFSQDVFIDFMAAQVKTLSFLAYVIKIYQDLVERYSSSLVQGMMNLLVNCPPSVTNMRKEFFIAARHILSAQEIRPKFLDVLDDLMNEDILIGQGYTVRDALRPLAYSTLADLTHHIRSELSLAKIARAIDLYGRNMHDDTLPFSIQQMSLRLLLNLVECVRQRVIASVNNPNVPGADELNTGVSSGTARRLLLHTLRLCVLKCRIVAEHYLPVLESTCIPESPSDSDAATGTKQRSATPFMYPQSSGLVGTDHTEPTLAFDKPSTDVPKSKLSAEDATKSAAPRIIDSTSNRPQLSHLDLRSLIKALMSGMRTIVTGMIQCPHEPGFGQTASASGSAGQTDRSKVAKPASSSSTSTSASSSSSQVATRFLTPDELMVLSDYFNYGMRMIDIVQVVVRDGKLYIKCQPSSKSPDERLLIETFALTFAQLSPVSFREIFSSKIDDFVLWCRRSPSYTNMALHLLSQLNKTSCFGHILLSYLVDRLERLGDGTDESVLYMRLLKLCFSSVNVAGTENEHVMKLHLRRIVQGSMQYCLTAKEPTAYLTLLRTLFRSIGGGAHDKLYREFFPLLPEMLSTLNRLLRSPHRATARDLLGELCVIVPVRLSTLLPYLSLLMEPLVYVLNCNTVNQGLRTLELCVDNMQPDFLHDHLHQVRGDMLLALYNSLHSSSEYVQRMSFKVLGKLGRFNRTNLLEVQRLRLDPGEGEAGPRLRFYLNEFRTQPIDLPIRSVADAAIEALQDVNVDLPTKIRAWELLQSVCLAALDLTSAFLWTSKTGSHVESIYAYLEGPAFLTAVSRFVQTVASEVDSCDLSDRFLVQHACCVDGDLDRDVMVRVLAGLFLAGLTKPLRDTQSDFIGFIVRHLTLMSITQFLLRPSDPTDKPDRSQAATVNSAETGEPMELERSEGSQHLNQGNASLSEQSTPCSVASVSERYRVAHETGSPALAQLVRNQQSVAAVKPTLDPVLLVDALQMIMGHEDKQLTRPMSVLLQIMHGTASAVLRGALDPASDSPHAREHRVQRAVAQLPLFSHLAHVLVDMLHHPAWYVKWGGCATVIYLTGLLHTSWFQMHFLQLLRGLLHCIHDLSSQMSQGALNMARDCSRLLVQTVFNQPMAAGLTLEPAGTCMSDSSQRSGTLAANDAHGAGRSTPGKRAAVSGKRRPVPATNSAPRRSGSLRRGRSASFSSTTSGNEPTEEGEEEDETQAEHSRAVITDAMETDTVGAESGKLETTDQGKHCESSTTYPLSAFLVDVIRELLDALLSETAAVREEARCLLRLLSHQLGRPLSVLLAPHWRQQLGHILPPQPPLRLPDLPISTQLVVLEANYFFGQSENGRSKSRSIGATQTTLSGPLAGFDLHAGGAELLRYDVTKKADRLFLIDVRALLTAPDPGQPGTAACADSTSASTTTTTGATAAASGQTSASASSANVGPTGRPTTTAASRTSSQPGGHRLRSIDLRVAACRVLSLTHYLTAQKLQNLSTLFKGICSEQEAIHEAAFACLKEFVSHTSVDVELRHANVKPILQNVRQTTNLRLNTARQLSYCAQLFPSTFSERLCDAIYSHLNALVDNLPSQQNVSSISTLTPPNLELCAVLVDLFHLIPLATAKHVSSLIELVVRAERSLNIEPTSPLRLPLVRFLARYPAETCMHLLTGSKWPYDALAQRIFLYVLKSPQGQSVTDYLKTNYHILCDLIRPTDLAEQKPTCSARFWLPRVGTPLTAACPRHLAIRAVHTIHQLFPSWLLHSPSHSSESPKSAKSRYQSMCSPSSWKATYHPVCAALLAYWRSDAFARRQASLTLVTLSAVPDTADPEGLCGVEYVESEPRVDPVLASNGNSVVPELTLPSGEALPMIASGTGNFEHWDEPRLILDCLLDCVKVDVENFDLLFVIVIGVNRLRSVAGLYPLRCFLDNLIKEAPVQWHRRLFLHFVTLVRHRLAALVDTSAVDPTMVVFGGNTTVTVEDMYRLMAHLILPSLAYALEHYGPVEELIGGPARPCEENENDLVYLFIHVLLDDSVLQVCTELRVMYYQLACLFVYYATDYIHVGTDTEHSPRLRRLIDFAWPCTTSSLSVVDLQEKYTGLQLLAHLIAKFRLPTRIAVQVFQCLAKGTHTETKKIVNPALDVLIPAWVQGPEDQKVLASTTRKIILEDHGIQSCIHIIGIIVRHADLYYPIRHQLLSHIIIIVSRLSTQQLPVEQRRLALDMIDTAAQWDHRCRQTLIEAASTESESSAVATVALGESTVDPGVDGDEMNASSQIPGNMTATTTTTNNALIPSENTPMNKTHRDQLLNLMIRFACQAVDSSQNGNLSEASVTRALSQLEFALRSDVWGGETCELRLSFIDRYFATDDNSAVSAPSSSPAAAVTPSNAAMAAGSGGAGSATSTAATQVTGASAASASSGAAGTAQSAHAGSPGLGTTQTNNMLMTLEVLRILFTSLESPTLLSNVKHFSAGLCSLLTRQLANVRLIRSCANLLRAMLERFPADASHRQKITTQTELFDIYSTASKAIQESFTLYSENGPKSTLLARLQSAFLLFQATQVHSNPHAFVDRCIVQLVKLTHRLIQDVITPSFGSSAQDSGASAQLTDLLITGLEVIKSRLNVVSHEMRKNAFGPDLCLIVDRARDPRLFRAVIKILRDWINVPKSEEHFAPTAREKVNFFHRLWLAYPRWVDAAPDIAREILECVYEVYSSGSLFKNHDLYVKLEQAFCCSMLAPFPEIRERFVSLYLDASQLCSALTAPQQPQHGASRPSDSAGSSSIGDPMCTVDSVLDHRPRSRSSSPVAQQQADADKESGSSADVDTQRASTCSTVAAPATSSLLVRLLFLYVSSSWDEAHFRDGFWLPLFFDILLCDVDTSLPPLLSASSSLFPVPPCVRETDLSPDSAFGPTAQLELTKLLELQVKGSQEASKVTFKNGLRGLLCLVHRHPALATQLMTQLWPQLWNRLLLRQPDPSTDPGTGLSDRSAPVGSVSSNWSSSPSDELSRFSKPSGAAADTLVFGNGCDASAAAGAATNGNSNLAGHTNLSINEIRCFAMPPLGRFLASDQHVNPAEPQPSALGAFLACLATTPDTVLIHLPLPVITYIGTSYNQWHSLALFLESLCARARRAISDSSGTPVAANINDFVYNVSLPAPDADSSAIITPIQASELPSGAATLSLISVYDGMNEPDYLSAAWWYRLTASRGPMNHRHPTGLLKCIEYAQHGLLLRALETSLDQLASTTSTLGSSSALGATGGGSISETSGGGSSASSNRAAAVAASTASAVARSQSASPPTLASATAQFSDYMNRAKLQDYCIRYLKQLGQWDSLETLASNMQTGSSYMSAPFGTTGAASCGAGSGGSTGTTGGSLGVGGSAYWGLKADAAWRRSDWSEVYASLSRLASESPRSDLCRYALIQGAACVAGRRTTSGFAAAVAAAAAAAAASTVGSSSAGADSDPYASSSVGEAGPGSSNSSTPGPNSSAVSAAAAAAGVVSANVSGSSGSPSGSSSSSSNPAVNSVVSMIQASETESHRIMSAVLREWRRMPLIVTSQHVPLLQIAHRAVEITEGNSLLAQYCGHVLAGPCLGQPGSSYTSPGQSGPGPSSSGQPGSAPAVPSSTASSSALRMPLSQALHDYKTVFKWWQSRPPSIGDDLGFWHDLFSWRQVVEESIITCHPYLQKFGPERANLIAVCERELALSQLQLARGARKYRFPSIAQQHLDRYTRMNLPPLFEKTKQEIKLKMAELRKDELLEGLELMEKTNIQQYEKKDRAKFFCYKAVFFSHFNKGDEATKNFGYATQMQDNIHKVWSIYGDFLENVYSSYPAAKREVAVSTTGIFAMQALMEAASVAGGLERRSRADLAKCLWLLTLDDTKGQQRLARTFEERASRVRPDAFLPWLPSLVTSLLRPEGRFIVPALRGVTATHPTVLYSLLRGLQHQLVTELSCDERLGELVQLAGSEPAGSFAHVLQARVRSALGSQAEDAEQRKQARVASATSAGGELSRAGSRQADLPVTAAAGRGSAFGPADLSAVSGGSMAGGGGTSGGLSSFSTVSPASSKKKKRVIVVMRGVEGERLSGGSPLSPDQQTQQQQSKKAPKDETELPEDASVAPGAPKKAAMVAHSADDPADDLDEFDVDDDTEEGELDQDEAAGRADAEANESNGPASGSSLAQDSASGSGMLFDPDAATSQGLGADQGTGCLSHSVTDGLHRVNLLMSQIRRRHAARIYAVDLFTAEVGGRLQPSWAEQLLTRLCSVLDYLQRLAWTRVSSGRHYRPGSVERLPVPDWLLLELRIELATACGIPIRSQSGWARLMELGQPVSVCASADRHPMVGERRKRESSSSSSSELSDKEEVKKPARSRKQQLGPDSVKPSKQPPQHDPTTKSAREQSGAKPSATAPKRMLPQSLRMTPAFGEVLQLAADRVRLDARRDPWFAQIHHELLKAVDDWENRSVLYVMQQITRHWIPLLEERVARLPTRMHLSDCGARRLMELPSLVVTANHVSAAPTSSTGLGAAVAPASVLLPSVPCLELPGESGLLQSTGGFLNSSAFSYSSPSSSPGHTTQSTGPNLALHLVIAEVFPHVARVRCAPGRLASPARRLGIRASNGRVFYYDLPALGYWSPAHSQCNSDSAAAAASAIAIQLIATAGARAHSLLSQTKARASNVSPLTLDGLCPAPYTAWRHMGPLHLFQMINDMLAGQPETAKRRLALFTPRMMEVGPAGLYLTEASASAPAASVGVASAHPLPSANPVTAGGLTALARPPPIVGAGQAVLFAGSDGLAAATPGPKPSSGSTGSNIATPAWAVSFAQTEQVAADANTKTKSLLPAPPPGPLPALVSNPNSSGGASSSSSSGLTNNLSVGGSAAVAAEAVGRPTGLDAGCHPACCSLTAVLEQACASWFQRRKGSNSADHAEPRTADLYAGSRELVCLFYELLLSISTTQQLHQSQPVKVTVPMLCKLFTDLSHRIPPAPYLKNALVSALGLLPESDSSAESATNHTTAETASEFPRGSLIRRWAASRMLDAESYWLFRHSLASHLGLISLMEQLFHLTPSHPACLIMDPRSGRAESRHVRFTLPVCTGPPGSDGTGPQTSAVSLLTSCFATVMGLRSPRPAVDATSKSSGQGENPPPLEDTSNQSATAGHVWTHDPSPVPFRLTPHMAGFVCLPGTAAHVGPFAVSLTTAAQALASAQRAQSLTSLYRTLVRGDYILWHRGRQAAVHAFQLLLGESSEPEQLANSDSDTDTESGTSGTGGGGGCKRKTKLFNELGVKAVGSSTARTDKLSSGPEQRLQLHQQPHPHVGCVMLPELSNEQLIQLITLTLDAMNTNLKSMSDYSTTEPGTWNSIAAATNPLNLAQMDPAYLPWL